MAEVYRLFNQVRRDRRQVLIVENFASFVIILYICGNENHRRHSR